MDIKQELSELPPYQTCHDLLCCYAFRKPGPAPGHRCVGPICRFGHGLVACAQLRQRQSSAVCREAAKQALKKELDTRIRELSHGLLSSVPVPAAFEGMEIHWSRCELARIPRCRSWNFTVRSLTAEPWLARGAKNTLGGNWPCLVQVFVRNLFFASAVCSHGQGQCERVSGIRLADFCSWLSGEAGTARESESPRSRAEEGPWLRFQDVASIPFPQASSWGVLLRPEHVRVRFWLPDTKVIAVISTLRLWASLFGHGLGCSSRHEYEGALQRPERLQSGFCRFQPAADTGLTVFGNVPTALFRR